MTLDKRYKMLYHLVKFVEAYRLRNYEHAFEHLHRAQSNSQEEKNEMINSLFNYLNIKSALRNS